MSARDLLSTMAHGTGGEEWRTRAEVEDELATIRRLVREATTSGGMCRIDCPFFAPFVQIREYVLREDRPRPELGAQEPDVVLPPVRCACACPDGPCDHLFNGEWMEWDDGRMASATCSRCGLTAMSHSMSVGP